MFFNKSFETFWFGWWFGSRVKFSVLFFLEFRDILEVICSNCFISQLRKFRPENLPAQSHVAGDGAYLGTKSWFLY